MIGLTPYSEPVYTGWSSVHWNATGWPSVHWNTTGRPSEYLQGTLEHHWKNLVEAAPHRNATGETSMPVWNDKMAGHQ